jgi:hypothetical protein
MLRGVCIVRRMILYAVENRLGPKGVIFITAVHLSAKRMHTFNDCLKDLFL